MLGLDEVDPLPVPNSPAIMQQMPSIKMPLKRKRVRVWSSLCPPPPPPRPLVSSQHPSRASRLFQDCESCNHLSIVLLTPGQK